MRAAFIRTLIELARTNKEIFLLVGDVGFSLVEPFAQEFPGRFINVGVAEQNMIGLAAGMALSGKTVFIYSLANFPSLRCLEQIRNDLCCHNANVKIIAAGGGLTYGELGITHYVIEDLAIMRVLPGMTVIAPGDPVESELATRAIANEQGPCYLRLQKTGDPIVHKTIPDFKIGRAITMRQGHDVTLIATGGILYNTLLAAEHLSGQGIQARVLSMHTIKPLDKEIILAAARETGAIITIEEHSIIGGLGGAAAEILAEADNSHLTFKRIGITDLSCARIGKQEYLREVYSLSLEGIVKEVRKVLNSKGKE